MAVGFFYDSLVSLDTFNSYFNLANFRIEVFISLQVIFLKKQSIFLYKPNFDSNLSLNCNSIENCDAATSKRLWFLYGAFAK